MTTMKAIIATGYGSPDVLEFQEVAKPTPKKNEVLVKVHASTVTQADAMMRTGKPYIGRLFLGLSKPRTLIPGTGFAGIIEEVGSEVTEWKVGDRVFGETAFGFAANAEYTIVPEDGVFLPLHESIDFQEAATFTDGPLTSYNFLTTVYELKKGEHVLINGASGSLGTAAIQIAKKLGAEVTAVCGSRNVGLVKSLGADHVIDYTQRDFTKGNIKYDVVYDTVGKSSFAECKAVLESSGEYISPVLSTSLLGQVIKTSMFGDQKAKFSATGTLKPNVLLPMLQALREMRIAGELKVVIDRQYPLEKVAEAHRYVSAGHKKGNVVIAIQ